MDSPISEASFDFVDTLGAESGGSPFEVAEKGGTFEVAEKGGTFEVEENGGNFEVAEKGGTFIQEMPLPPHSDVDLFPYVLLPSLGDKVEANFGPNFAFNIADGI
uniref:Uncharacterized protein n=1 Tax=Globodera pallida TaxID=36090 RepID=A0A183CBS3_GLOPA